MMEKESNVRNTKDRHRIVEKINTFESGNTSDQFPKHQYRITYEGNRSSTLVPQSYLREGNSNRLSPMEVRWWRERLYNGYITDRNMPDILKRFPGFGRK